jgi:hypothetical protein
MELSMRARREVIVLAFALVSAVAPVFADRPEWVEQLPFTEDDYWGVGRGATQQEAEESARREILMQLSSRVKAVVTMELATGSGAVEASESMDAYFTGNTLRGAELVERYSEDDKHWVLMKYCDECGKALMQSALVRFEDKLGYEAGDLIEGLNDESLSRSYKIERRLGELELSDFSADDIIIRFEERMIVIMIVNFLPFDSSLNPGQLQSLDVLSASLLKNSWNSAMKASMSSAMPIRPAMKMK